METSYREKSKKFLTLWYLLFILIAIWIVFKATWTMTMEKEYWVKYDKKRIKENITIPAYRGNILSADNKLLASSLPEFRIAMDLNTQWDKQDSMLTRNLKNICDTLSMVIPDKSAAYFKRRIQEGRKRKSHYWVLYNRRITYNQLTEIKKIHFFETYSTKKTGLIVDAYNNRKTIFGSLAAQTLGRVYADVSQGARSGIELAFDSLLKGRDGIGRTQKVLNSYINIVEKEPVHGYDIRTTIDIDMQDICEKALLDELKLLNANVGVVILMEVKTGEVKAIVNLSRTENGNYVENESHAISDMMEPGSTFKTASIMVALEDGYITPDTQVDTGDGIKDMYGSKMRDHNWNKGGYHTLDVTRIMEVSSNIGVSTLIDEHYKHQPQKFVDGLHKLGLGEKLGLQIQGEGTPNIKGPKEKKYFAKTDLPWMSIGYSLQVAPIHMLTFYNAIANDGKMVKPIFVKEVLDKGKVVESYKTEVLRKKICSDKTLEQIRTILKKVVSEGLGKKAGNDIFPVAGKTGTAQISQGGKGYKGAATMKYLVSFCGYFPADNPKYSCIVAIQKTGYPASGGTMAGPVFSKIAEKIYSQQSTYSIKDAIDSTSNVIPEVKKGNMKAAKYVLNKLDIPYKLDENRDEESVWGEASMGKEEVTLNTHEMPKNLVPNVRGMGAKDAVNLLEAVGLKVTLSGVGSVYSQSIPPGHKAVRGNHIHISLR